MRLPELPHVLLGAVERRCLEQVRRRRHPQRGLARLRPLHEHTRERALHPSARHRLRGEPHLRHLLPALQRAVHLAHRPPRQRRLRHAERLDDHHPQRMPRAEAARDAGLREAAGGAVEHAPLLFVLRGLAQAGQRVLALQRADAEAGQPAHLALRLDLKRPLPQAAQAGRLASFGLGVHAARELVLESRTHERRHPPVVKGAAQREAQLERLAVLLGRHHHGALLALKAARAPVAEGVVQVAAQVLGDDHHLEVGRLNLGREQHGVHRAASAAAVHAPLPPLQYARACRGREDIEAAEAHQLDRMGSDGQLELPTVPHARPLEGKKDGQNRPLTRDHAPELAPPLAPQGDDAPRAEVDVAVTQQRS